MLRRTRLCLAVAAAVAAAATVGGEASARTAAIGSKPAKRTTPFLVGINDEASTLYGDPARAFEILTALRAQVVRVNLYWGGTKWAVAQTRPADAADPGDPAYDWSLYDRLVRYAARNDVQVVFSILFTPAWANGGKARNVAPTNAADLQDFAYAAAARYSGYWAPPEWQQDPADPDPDAATPLPAVTMWTAWNEPNNPVWLTPQYKRVGGKWVMQSARDYAAICSAVYTGVHSVLISPEKGAPSIGAMVFAIALMLSRQRSSRLSKERRRRSGRRSQIRGCIGTTVHHGQRPPGPLGSSTRPPLPIGP